MNTIEYCYDAEKHIAACIITYKGVEFSGHAICHPNDYDFESERTGYNIAESRAQIEKNKYIKNCELTPALNALKHVQSCMAQSKKYNLKSYEAKMVSHQIKHLEAEINRSKKRIDLEKDMLRNYIESKDKLYQRLRDKKN